MLPLQRRKAPMSAGVVSAGLSRKENRNRDPKSQPHPVHALRRTQLFSMTEGCRGSGPVGWEPPCMPWCQKLLTDAAARFLKNSSAARDRQVLFTLPHRTVGLSEALKERSWANNLLGGKS